MGLFSRHFSRTSQSITARWWWTVDRAMLAFIFVLYIIGAFMIATASPSVAIRIGAYEYLFLIKHFIVLLPSIIVMLVISLFDVDTLRRASMIAFVGCIVLLIYTLFFGLEVKGAKRWIDLPFFSLQPSEFAKPAFIVVTAWLMARYKENSQFKGHYYAWGLFLFLIALLLLQPDLGMTFVVTVSFFSVMFLAGLPFRYVFILAGLGVTAFVLIYMSF